MIPSLKEIRSAANILFKIDIGLKTRERKIVRKRQVAHYVAHKIFKHSSEKTGFEIGKKDHATVLYSCKVISNEIGKYPEIKKYVTRLNNMCLAKDNKESPSEIIMNLKKSKTLDINVKIELNRILKELKNEGN